MFFLAKFLRDKAAKHLKKDSGEEEKPFLEHLEDLRKTLFKIIITLVVVTIGTFIFNKGLLELIQWPLYMANIPQDARLTSTFGPMEGMMLAIKVSFYSGIVLSFPLLLFFLGEFILPGLKENEKKLVLPSLFVGALLFAGGICFSYFIVIPRALEFFYNFSVERGWKYDLRSAYYVSFAVQLVLVFGICFELPVVVMAMVKLEILSHRVMRNTRSTAIVVMVIVSAVITPTTDVITLSFLAGPLIVLYEICIWLAWWLEKKRAREDARERARGLLEAEPMPEPPAGGGSSDTAIAAPPTRGLDHIDSDHVEPTSPTPAYDADNEFKQSAVDIDEPDISPEGEISGVADGSGTADDSSAHAAGGENQDSDTTDPHHEDHGHGDDYWSDPYHHEHHHDDYYSGPTEELKRSLREELSAQIKAELRIELLAELRKEMRAGASGPKRISLDPRRIRRPR